MHQFPRKDVGCTHMLTPPASISTLAPDFLPKPHSPALAGVQIPSSLHSLGLGKEWVFKIPYHPPP